MIKVVSNKEQTATGPLPITLNSDGTPLDDYKLYGTSEGAGVETENLFNANNHQSSEGFWNNTGGYIPQTGWYVSLKIPVKADTEYTFNPNSTTGSSAKHLFYNAANELIGNIASGKQTFTTPANCSSMAFSYRTSSYDITLYEGSVISTSYIPYGYKIPMTVESGEESTSIPIYIGDSKLGAEEYVDYGEQKVYKRTENNFPYTKAGEYAFGSQAKVVSNGEGEFNIIGKITRNLETSVIPLTKPFTFPSVEDDEHDTFFLGNPVQATNMNIRFYDENGVLITYYAFNSQWRLVYNYPSLSEKTAYGIGFGSNASASYSVDAYYVHPMFAKDQSITEYIPYLQPTNPPVPLPEISTYSGENTLSCSEELGDESQITYVGPVEETITKITRTEDDGLGNITEHVLYKEGS